MPGGNVIVDVDLCGGEKRLGRLDFLGGPSRQQLGQLLRPHARRQAEAFGQLLPGRELCLRQGQRHQAGVDLVFGQGAGGLQRPLETGLGKFVVLTDVDGFDAAQLGDQALPIGGPDADGDRRYGGQAQLHQRQAIGHPLGDDHLAGPGQQTVLVEQQRVVDEVGDVGPLVFVVNRQFLVFPLLPAHVRGPRRLAADHEHHPATAPVGKDDPALEKWRQAVLAGGTESAGGGELPLGETVLTPGQLGDRAGRVVRVADQEIVDGLLAQGVFGFQPVEDLRRLLESGVVKPGQRGQRVLDPQFEGAVGFRLGQTLLAEAIARQRRQARLLGEIVPGLAVAVRHRTGLPGGDRARLNELHELQHITADSAAEAVPALLVEHHVQRQARLALMVGAVAHQALAGLLGDPSRQEFPGHVTDVHLGDEPVILPDVIRSAHTHSASATRAKSASACWAASRNRGRKVRRSSTWQRLAQFWMPQWSPRTMAVRRARVTPV